MTSARGNPRVVSLLVAILLALATAIDAQELEIGALVGTRSGGSFSDPATNRDQTLETSVSFGLLAEFPVLGPGRYIQLLWSRQDSTVDFSSVGASSVTVDYLQIGGAYRWRDAESASPYVAAGIGVTLIGGEGTSGTTAQPSGSLALGFRWAAGQRVGIRIEGRGYGTFSVGAGSIHCSGGCSATLSTGGMIQLEGSAALTFLF